MRSKYRTLMDVAFRYLFQATGLLVILLLGGILAMLLFGSVQFFMEVSPFLFLSGAEWAPDADTPAYGVLPLLVSTLLVSVGAMAIAVPVGILTAAYLAEFAHPKVEAILKPAIELLAAIPSVAVGFLGIVLVGPAIAAVFGLGNGLNALNGAILLAVMALPTIVTISEDAIRAVPQTYREASLALGADRWATLYRVTLPAAMPGIIAAVMLGLGRALGETMTVLMATGNAALMPRSFLDAIRTITATIAIEMGEVPFRTTHYFALFAIAGVLFLITLAVNLLGEYFAQKLRKFHAE